MGTERRVSSIVREEGFKLLPGTGMFLPCIKFLLALTNGGGFVAGVAKLLV